ncbi:DUF6221 family protein [Streptomyces syringium]|uniref:DUF6221 family protein n=1 Tax=Streptomyces syringium TaxID=76729 RepID=UPI0033EA32D9
MTVDLVAFLHARLDEDEQAARACASAPWAIEIPPMVHVSAKAVRDSKWKWGTLGYVASVERDADRVHIVRHDPARVLAEVEAKRRLLKLHEPRHDDYTWICDTCSRYDTERQMRVYEYAPCEHLKILALPYSDHPDYREGWRP